MLRKPDQYRHAQADCLTSIGMLKERNRERDEDKAAHNEVGGHTVHASQHRHKWSPQVELVLDAHLRAIPQHQRIQPVSCTTSFGIAMAPSDCAQMTSDDSTPALDAFVLCLTDQLNIWREFLKFEPKCKVHDKSVKCRMPLVLCGGLQCSETMSCSQLWM